MTAERITFGASLAMLVYAMAFAIVYFVSRDLPMAALFPTLGALVVIAFSALGALLAFLAGRTALVQQCTNAALSTLFMLLLAAMVGALVLVFGGG